MEFTFSLHTDLGVHEQCDTVIREVPRLFYVNSQGRLMKESLINTPLASDSMHTNIWCTDWHEQLTKYPSILVFNFPSVYGHSLEQSVCAIHDELIYITGVSQV